MEWNKRFSLCSTFCFSSFYFSALITLSVFCLFSCFSSSLSLYLCFTIHSLFSFVFLSSLRTFFFTFYFLHLSQSLLLSQSLNFSLHFYFPSMLVFLISHSIFSPPHFSLSTACSLFSISSPLKKPSNIVG